MAQTQDTPQGKARSENAAQNSKTLKSGNGASKALDGVVKKVHEKDGAYIFSLEAQANEAEASSDPGSFKLAKRDLFLEARQAEENQATASDSADIKDLFGRMGIAEGVEGRDGLSGS
jgi:hypothetical protein